MDLSQVLLQTQSTDHATRTQAEAHLQTLQNQNMPAYMALLCQELMNEQRPPQSRQAAGLILKNLVDAKDPARKLEFQERWKSTDLQTKNTIKQQVVQTLASPNLDAGRTAAQVVCRIALIELERGEWADLIQTLVQNVGVTNNNLKIAALMTLGLICEEIDPSVLGDQSNAILTAVIQGMQPTEDVTVRIAATRSLTNALIFIKKNFENEQERNIIMTTICQACVTPGQDDNTGKLKLQAFECLVRVADLYYDVLPPYISDVGKMTFAAIQDELEPVGRMAIEFWCTICDEEIELLGEMREAQANQEQPSRPCLMIINQALNTLAPLLLQKLTLLSEYDVDNIASSAGTCITLLANTAQDAVVPLVLPFVQEHIASAEWNKKAAAIQAFGMILEGPAEEQLRQLIGQALPMILQSVRGNHDKVKDSAAWTLSRVCEFHGSVLGPHLQSVVPVLVDALKDDEPSVANNACWALHFLAYELGEQDPGEEPANTNPISPYFHTMIQSLLVCSERDDSDDVNLRISAYESINTVIGGGAADTLQITMQLLPSLLTKLQQTFQMDPSLEKEAQGELQGLLCGVLTAIINKLKDKIQPYADQMMTIFLQVFQQQSSSVHEEALMSVSALASVLPGDGFLKYATSVMPYLLLGLRNYQEYEVCGVAVGLVGDMCRALESRFRPFANDVIQTLLHSLQQDSLDNSVKPTILGVFGDIAMAVGVEFEPLLHTVMSMLYQASQLSVDMEDEDMVEYLNEIREAVLDAFIGIVSGLCSGPVQKPEVLVPYLDAFFSFVQLVAQDQTRELGVTKNAVSLVGDLCSYLQNRCTKHISDPTVIGLVREALQTPDVEEEASYARQAIGKLIGDQPFA